MLAPAWLANTHLSGAGWLWLRFGLTAAVAVLAALTAPAVLAALPAPLEDDGTPAADYQLLSRWRPLPLLAGAGAAVIAGSLVWCVPWPLLASVLPVAAAAPLLAYVDLRAHLLPDPVTLAASTLAGIALVAGCLATGHGSTLLIAVGIGVATTLVLLALALVGGGLGLGDVKLAFALSATAAAVSLAGAVLLLILAVALGGLTALVLVVARRRDRRAHLAFGPFLLAGWWLALLWEGSALSAR